MFRGSTHMAVYTSHGLKISYNSNFQTLFGKRIEIQTIMMSNMCRMSLSVLKVYTVYTSHDKYFGMFPAKDNSLPGGLFVLSQ